jgi:gliding motility-associated-like protein
MNVFGIETRPIMRRACLSRIDSTLDLLWFKPTDNCSSFTNFNVYGRDNPLSLFQILASSINFSQTNLSIKLPNLKNWEFYVVYNTTCDGLDSVTSDTIFIDNAPPINSELDSVSVDLATQKTLLGWSKNISPDVKGYKLYHVTSTNSNIKDTTGTGYLDISTRRPDLGPVSYSVAAFDSCNNASLISTPHQTIFLQSTIDQCKKQIQINWSDYVGWQVDSYEIYRKINGGSFQKVGSVSFNFNQFVYTFSVFGDNYCFYVRAIKSGGGISSSSNTTCVNTSNIVATKNSYIAKASVQNKNIELVLVTEIGTSIEKINLYKSINNSNAFNLWQTINTVGGTISLIDNTVSVSKQSYSYFFTTEGPCDLIFDSSQISKTILLDVNMINPGDQSLNWTLYNDFIKNTKDQDVLLGSSSNWDKSSPWNILSSIDNLQTESSDQTTFNSNQEEICYCIRAIENDPMSPFNRQDTSYSNIVCLTADPIVYFPNAIQINGFNNTFFPKGLFIDYEKSSYRVYNRWGEIIYECADIRKPWDGTHNGQFVQSDVYVFRAHITGINGKSLFFDGTITVLK